MVATGILLDQADFIRIEELNRGDYIRGLARDLTQAAVSLELPTGEAKTLRTVIEIGAAALVGCCHIRPRAMTSDEAAEFRSCPAEFILARRKPFSMPAQPDHLPFALAMAAHDIRSKVDDNDLSGIVTATYTILKQYEGEPILAAVVQRPQGVKSHVDRVSSGDTYRLRPQIELIRMSEKVWRDREASTASAKANGIGQHPGTGTIGSVLSPGLGR